MKPGLPDTGVDAVSVVVGGGFLLLGGTVLLLVVRRRRLSREQVHGS